jgi:hypothetical protein
VHPSERNETRTDIAELKSFDRNMFKEKPAKKLVCFYTSLITDNYVRVILKRVVGVHPLLK